MYTFTKPVNETKQKRGTGRHSPRMFHTSWKTQAGSIWRDRERQIEGRRSPSRVRRLAGSTTKRKEKGRTEAKRCQELGKVALKSLESSLRGVRSASAGEPGQVRAYAAFGRLARPTRRQDTHIASFSSQRESRGSHPTQRPQTTLHRRQTVGGDQTRKSPVIKSQEAATHTTRGRAGSHQINR